MVRLEKENKHLLDLVDQMRNSNPDCRSKQLEEENRSLSDSIFEYKTMISKLTKVGIIVIATIIAVVVTVVMLTR